MKDTKKVSPVVRMIAVSFAGLILLAILRPALLTGPTMPRFWPTVIGICSSIFLYFVRPIKTSGPGLMRLGFHIGMMAFFVVFPLLSPDEINPEISEEAHSTLGWALFLSLLGFEMAYWLLSVARKAPTRAPVVIRPTVFQMRLLMVVLGVGLAAWFFSIWDYSQAINAPIASVLLTMRGQIEGTTNELARPGYFGLLLASGIFLSAVAASLLLTLYKLVFPLTVFCWITLTVCAAIGFLSGTRAIFLYSFIPLAITGWKKLSTLRFMTSMRWPGAIAAGAILIMVWSVMTAMRGADIREYEGGLEEISVVAPAQGALDIYSMTAEVVETFPDRIPFVQGESIVPLVLGWVPRSVWPSKPYPFGLYMNLIKGETIQARAASLAVGLTGEGYGNFGLVGAFIWSFLLGVACREGDRLVDRLHPDDTLHLLLGGMSMVWVAMIVRGGVPEMFYMGLQIMAFPLLLSRYLMTRQKKAARRLSFVSLKKFQASTASYR